MNAETMIEEQSSLRLEQLVHDAAFRTRRVHMLLDRVRASLNEEATAQPEDGWRWLY